MVADLWSELRYASKLLGDPRLLWRLTRYLLQRTSLRRAFDPGIYSPKRADCVLLPDIVYLKLINACNLRCKMCGQYGEKGVYRHQQPSGENDVLPVDVYGRFFDQFLEKRKPVVYLHGGGEPLLYPEIPALLDVLGKQGCLTWLTTNGTKVSEHAEILVRLGLNFMNVSILGPPTVHDAICGLEGAWDKAIEGIERVVKEKRDARRSNPRITAAVTVIGENQSSLERLCDFLPKDGLDAVIIKHPQFLPPEAGAAYESFMKTHCGVEATSWKGYCDCADGVVVDGLLEQLKTVRKKRYPFPVIAMPSLTPKKLRRYYESYYDTLGRRRCLLPWNTMTVEANGTVVPCVTYPDFPTGNITEETLEEIWNGPAYRKFRRILFEGLMPICNRCCDLHYL